MAHSTAKTAIWSFLEQGGSRVVSLVVQIVLARLLDPEAFGVLAILLVVTNIADSIAQGGLGAAIIQKEDSDERTYTTAFWLSLFVAAVLYLLILVSSPLFEAFYGMPGLSEYLNVLAIVVVFNSANSIQRSILQKKMDFKSLFVTTVGAASVSGAAGVAAAVAGWGVWALVAQAVFQSVAMCVAMATKVAWRPSFYFHKPEAGELFSYGWKIAATSMLGVLYSGLSDLVIGRTCSATGLGYYSQGRKYPMAIITMTRNAMQNVMFPALAQKQGDRKAFSCAAKRALVTGTFVIAPVSLFCAAAAEPLVAIVLTEKWLPCVPIFQMVCISHAFLMSTSMNSRAYLALGRSDLYLRLQIVKVAIGATLICSAAVLTRDIYVTAFITCLTTLFDSIVIDAVSAKRAYGYSAMHQLADVMPTIAVAVVAWLVSYALSRVITDYIAMLMAQMLAYWAVYLLGARLMRIDGLQDCLGILKVIVEEMKGKVSL